MSSEPTRPLLLRPASAAVLVALALAGWGFNWWQQSHAAPVQAHIEAGNLYLQQGKGPEAEKEWQEAVRLDPRNAAAWDVLADYYLTFNRWVEARTALNHVLELQPDTPQVHYRLAQSAVELKDEAAARQQSEAELKHDPNHVGALSIMAKVLTRANEDQARLKVLRHLVELQPKDPQYVSQLATALIKAKEYAQAKPFIEAYIKLEPDSVSAHVMHGAALLNTNPSPQDLKLAESELKRALAVQPNDPVARLFLGRVYLRLHQPKDAIYHLEKLDRLATAHESYLFDLARAYQMDGNVPTAEALRRRYADIIQRNIQVKRLNSVLYKNPRDFEALLDIGLVLLGSEKPVGAENNLKVAAQLRPHEPRVKAALAKLENQYVQQLNLANVALQKGDFSQIGRPLSQAMMLRPHDPRTVKALNQYQALSSKKVPASSPTPSPGDMPSP